MAGGERLLTSRVRVRVPGKINLFLAIRGSRPDGYHELVSIMQTVSLHDTVTVELDQTIEALHPAARQFMELEFAVDGPERLPDGDDNLAMQAARCLMEVVGLGNSVRPPATKVPVTRLHLAKAIPMAAGMAGGSADAAATLVALNQLWEAGLNRYELAEMGAVLGADIPFCVGGGTALATATGTATAQVLTRGVYHWVIGISTDGLSTPEVFRAFDAVTEPSAVEPDAVLQALRTGDAEALGAALYNDLETATFHLRPGLADAKRAMLDAGALGATVSGSGPTLVALAATRQHAEAIAAQVGARFDRVEIAMSPAGGPESVKA